VLRLLLADLRSNVSPLWPAPLYWPRVIGKALFAPTAHVVILYRLSTACYAFVLTRPLAYVLRSIAVVWGGTEIHPSARIGPGLCLVHSLKVVIGPGVQIGANARIGHGVTIAGDTGPTGVRSERTGIPVLGDNVTVALDSIILGPVTIGDGAFVAAQSLVLHDVPAGAIVRGSPAKVVRYVGDQAEGGKALRGGGDPV
jgi:serine O-acetyltransferase